jgi:hypothetical protein
MRTEMRIPCPVNGELSTQAVLRLGLTPSLRMTSKKTSLHSGCALGRDDRGMLLPRLLSKKKQLPSLGSGSQGLKSRVFGLILRGEPA